MAGTGRVVSWIVLKILIFPVPDHVLFVAKLKQSSAEHQDRLHKLGHEPLCITGKKERRQRLNALAINDLVQGVNKKEICVFAVTSQVSNSPGPLTTVPKLQGDKNVSYMVLCLTEAASKDRPGQKISM